MQGSAAGGRGKAKAQSYADSEHDSASEELAKLVQETEQQNASASADITAMGSNAENLNQYLQKLQKDMDDCLKDRYATYGYCFIRTCICLDTW